MVVTAAATYYDVLGIAIDADVREVRRAYRRPAQAAHPDTDLGSADEFLEVNRAYEVLKDDESRRAYDLYLRGLKMTETAVVRTNPLDALCFDAPGVSSEPSVRSKRSSDRRSRRWRLRSEPLS